jgi:hypothetical protein
MLFVGSGYVGTGNGMPGNVLPAFSAEWRFAYVALTCTRPISSC